MKEIIFALLIIIYQINSQSLFSFGQGSLGRLGNGQQNQKNSPQKVSLTNTTKNGIPEPIIVLKAACGQYHNVFYANDGELYSFGYNNFGQLGIGIPRGDRIVYSIPVKVNQTQPVKVRLIGASNSHYTIIVDEDDKMWSFGYDTYGYLGTGATGSFGSKGVGSVELSNLQGSSIADLQVANEFSVILTGDGKVYSWGRNAKGECGNGKTNILNQPTFVTMPEGVLISAISATYSHTLVITKEKKKVLAWGVNSDGQLGTGDKKDALTPISIKLNIAVEFQLISHIAAGEKHSTIYDKFVNKFWSWGDNQYGVIGDNTILPQLEPVESINHRKKLLTDERVDKMYAGRGNTFVLTKPNQRLIGFGRNDRGQLGDGTITATTVGELVQISGELKGKKILDIAPCYEHSLVLTASASTVSFSLFLIILSFVVAF